MISGDDKEAAVGAYTLLAYCYEEGLGEVKIDKFEAFSLYQKAYGASIDGDCNVSLENSYRLAICYEEGVGVKRNLKEAIELVCDVLRLQEGLLARKKFALMFEKGLVEIEKK